MVFGKHVNIYYKKYFFNFFFGVIFLIVVDYVQVLIPDILGNIVDNLNTNSLTNALLSKYIMYMLLIALVMFIGRLSWRIFVFGGAINISTDLREKMFLYSEKLSQRYYQENKTGALMSLFTNDLETIEDTFASGTIMLTDAIFLGGISFYKMFRLNWKVTLIALIPMILLGCCGWLVEKYMSIKYEKRQQAFEDLSDFANENFSGIRVIKAFVKEAKELRAFSVINKRNKETNIDFVRIGTLFDLCIELLIYLVFAILLGGSGYLVYQYSKGASFKFTVGDCTKFVGYFDTLVWPVLALGQIISLSSRAKASVKRISALLDEKIEIKDDKIVFVDNIQGEITFNHFNFQYPDGKNKVLKDVSFTIKAGESVGIVGRIGSGKSTLVNVLLRLYNIEDNKIFIDGKDIMHLPIKKVRESIGYAPQDNFLFSDTVKNNIAFANENVSSDVVEEAAIFSDVHENIMSFPEGYNTVTGERGVTLSGGQKQRISISRAVLKNPPILILDDSVSAVDLKTEETILENIQKYRKGKTTLLVASRVSTVKKLDKILVLNNGQIEAFGTDKELMISSPTYRRMVELQQLESEVA